MFGFLVGFRKFFAFFFYFVVCTVLMIMGYISGDHYMAQTTAGLTAFLGTNIGEHLLNLGKEWIQGKWKDISGEEESEE